MPRESRRSLRRENRALRRRLAEAERARSMLRAEPPSSSAGGPAGDGQGSSEERLRADHRRLAAALDRSPVTAYTMDRALRYTWIQNPATRSSPGEVLGRTDRELFGDGDDVLRLAARKQRVLDTGEGTREEVSLLIDGVERWYDLTIQPLLEGGAVTGLTGVSVDISARKRIERDLRDSREELAKAFHGSAAAMTITRLADGRVLEVNDRALEVMRLARHEVIGRTTVGVGAWTSPEERAAFLRALVRDGTVANGEFSFGRPDGERWTGLVFAHLTELGGEPAVISSIVDITERKRAEEALRASEEALRCANQRLREADQRKNDFLAVLSHELRNPLAPIRNALFLLERAVPGTEQARRSLSVIDRQVRHLVGLIDDLLDVTRIARGKIRLQREPLELTEVVRGASEDYRPLFEASGVALDVELPGRPVRVVADRTRIAQVIGNLLQNAAKFTPRGGRTRLSLAAERGDAVIEVRDDGAGLEPELMARLFEPFVQSSQTLDRSRGGLGLGLALVKGLAELHGGRVAVASEGPGRGATFTVRLQADAGADDGAVRRDPARDPAAWQEPAVRP